MDDVLDDNNNSIVLSNEGIDWTPEHEQILVEWADKAMCYRWLHSKSNAMFSSLNTWYTIPVIVISTLTGTANFAQERVPIEYQSFFVMTVGGFNILAGIITTIQQFLKITQLNEAHRVSSIAWDKFYRNIKIEIARHPDERMDVNQLLKISKEEFDRLIETSPDIPDKIIDEFKTVFTGSFDFSEIVKPEVCGKLVSTERYRNQWSTSDNIAKKNSLKQQKDKKMKQFVETFMNDFTKMNGRDPIESEIVDNLKEQLEIVQIKQIIEKIFNEKNKTILLEDNASKLTNTNVVHMEISELPV